MTSLHYLICKDTDRTVAFQKSPIFSGSYSSPTTRSEGLCFETQLWQSTTKLWPSWWHHRIAVVMLYPKQAIALSSTTNTFDNDDVNNDDWKVGALNTRLQKPWQQYRTVTFFISLSQVVEWLLVSLGDIDYLVTRSTPRSSLARSTGTAGREGGRGKGWKGRRDSSTVLHTAKPLQTLGL